MASTITAIIQARMTSSRLPGKVMMRVLGKPLLQYQIDRIKSCQRIDRIVVATTDNLVDQAIADICKKLSISVFRGQEFDVLDRYYQAAKYFSAHHIMRITGDCPLIDPVLCDQLVEIYKSSRVDLVHTGQSFPEGVDCEIVSFEAIRNAWLNAELPSEREHCTLYLHNHPEKFKKVTHENINDESRFRFTVDQEEDFDVVKEIIEYFSRVRKENYLTSDIIDFLIGHPKVCSINANILRNEGLILSLEEDNIDTKN